MGSFEEYIGTWTKTSEINDRPVYQRGDRYLSHSGNGWVMTNTPGSELGWMFSYYPTSVQCPQQVSKWVYWSGQWSEDDSLKVTCGTSKCLHVVHDSVYIAHISECTGDIPATPSGATVDYDGSNAVLTLVTYTCSDDSKVFSVVSCE